MPIYKLRYLDLRARGEAIRMLFHLAGAPFEDERIARDAWQGLKDSSPFGKLPVLVVDGQPLPQTVAILRYLGREHGFAGEAPLDSAMIDAFVDQVEDMMKDVIMWIRVVLGFAKGDKTEMKTAVQEQSTREVFEPAWTRHMSIFESALKKNPSGYLVGSTVSFTDVHLVCMVRMIQALHPDKSAKILAGSPAVEQLVDKIESDPRLDNYMKNRAPLVTY